MPYNPDEYRTEFTWRDLADCAGWGSLIFLICWAIAPGVLALTRVVG